MSVKFTSPSSVTVTGTTYENEPVIKSDGASSDVMEWAASTGSSSIKIRENSANDLVLDVEGNLELADRVASVTSSTTVGAVFLYSTKDDSDGGAWRKKCKGLSWFDEGSSATRSARSEFPAMALIVADNVSDTETLTIYDLDDPAMPLWMQFTVTTQASPYHDFWRDGRDVTSIAALNGRLYFGTTEGAASQSGLKVVDFVSDRLSNHNTGASAQWDGYFDANVANRNSATKIFLGNTFSPIVHASANDVAATVLEGAEIGALGLPIPTVAVATDGGVSVIHPSGDVYDVTSSYSSSYTFAKKLSIDGNILAFQMDAALVERDGWWLDLRTLYANETVNGNTNAGGLGSFSKFGENGDILFAGDNVSALAKDAIGTEAGLSVYKRNTGNHEESAVAYITSVYNTGYLVGDIRGVWLANTSSGTPYGHDRSVKANALTLTGGLTKAVVATGSELNGYSGFSASNYLSISDAAQGSDFDFGTGDFSIMFWVKSAATGSYEDYVARSDTTVENGDWLVQKMNNETIRFYRNNAGWITRATSTRTIGTSWVQVAVVRRSSVSNIYIDGEYDTSTADAFDYTPSGGSPLTVGVCFGNSTSGYPATNASLSLLRISATAPTPQQIKEIYEAEKPLFAANAKCLLQSDGGSPNAINDLAFDKSTGLLHAYQNGSQVAENRFRGLEMVESYGGYTDGWSAASAAHGSVAGGVKASARTNSTGGVLVDLPSIDVRAELNEGESKIPDDGKLHFSGVTTDATQTTIGAIFIDENETYTLRVKATAHRYGEISSDRVFTEIEQTFYRKLGADIQEPAAHRKIEDLVTSSCDVSLARSTGNNTMNLKVTGIAATRIVWTASVEVQRISDKTYER